MHLRKIQQIQYEFIKERKWERFNASQVFTHLIEELGEIASYLLYDEKYKIKGAGHAGVDCSIEQEFAQSFNLFLQLAIKSGIDLEKAWLNENKRNIKRFNPELWQELAKKDQEE